MNQETAIERAKHALDILKLHAAYKDTFETPSGQIVLKHLAKKFGGDPFVAGATDITNHNQGRQYVVRCILRYLKRAPEELLTLESENQNG